MLEQSEYIEQSYLFQLMRERVEQQVPMQEMLHRVQSELLSTTKLAMAVDYLLTELKHGGMMQPAFMRLSHYFTPFQTYLVAEAERDTGQFEMRVALRILEAEAKFRAQQIDYAPNRQGMFLFQFEAICRNALRYDPGIKAIEQDPIYDTDWIKWITTVRANIGFLDLADLIFLHSEAFQQILVQEKKPVESQGPFLFGVQEGRIAHANRRKDPQYLLNALQRHLNYPKVPIPVPYNNTPDQIDQMKRKIERIESRIRLLEEENRGGIDLTKFFVPPPNPS